MSLETELMKCLKCNIELSRNKLLPLIMPLSRKREKLCVKCSEKFERQFYEWVENGSKDINKE